MNGDLDPNSIAAEFVKQNLDSLVESGRWLLKGTADKVRLKLDRTYKAYLAAVSEKYSKAKSFLLRGEPVPLYRFYVPLDLQRKDEKVVAPGIPDILKITSNAVITGSAGCGKSMLIRHLLLDCLLSKARVPVFIELRHFNSFDGDLHDLIMKTLSSHKFALDDSYVSKAIKDGHFILFLDGYDEVGHEKRKHVRDCIHDFAEENDKNAVVLTSRPDPELEGWQAFTLFKVAPLSLQQAYSLVEKLPFDEQLRSKFLSDLRSELFHKHESFLSNPLLLSIMLLSYGQSATIPNKVSVFYNQAYEALFERHDVLKDGFKRQLLSPLDIQDFARLFSAFCIQAFDRRKLEFTHTEALEYIEAAQGIAGIKCNKESYLQDLIQAVCLMVQDGLQIVYAHRSFQEYFAARFICEARPEVQQQLMNKYVASVRTDSVFSMLHEMRPEVVERHYIIPGLDQLFEKIGCKKSLGLVHYRRFLEAYVSEILLDSDEIGFVEGGTKGSRMFDVMGFAMRRCRPLIGWTGFQVDPMAGKALARKFGKKLGMNTEISVKDPRAAQLIRELAGVGGWFSLEMLRLLKQMRVALSEKAKLEEKTLESILKGE
jgi:hypothetical protein